MPLYMAYCHYHPHPFCGTVTCDTPQEAAQILFDAHRSATRCTSHQATVQALDGEQLLFHVDLATGHTRLLSAHDEPLLVDEGVTDRESGPVPHGTSGRVLRKTLLVAAIESRLPDLARAAQDPDADAVAFTQDAFAADYQPEEYYLLGMAVKYAGIHGKVVEILPSAPASPPQQPSPTLQ